MEEREIRRVTKIHPMLITKYYLSLINIKDKKDPIRKMIVPSHGEIYTEGSYDTSGEAQNTKMPGLQHKYKQTALILATNRCAAYCRHCFRKRLVGLPSHEIISRFNQAVDYIKKHKEINNVLISGGDPFILPTKILKKFLEKLSPMRHIDFIRFGTRVPVTFPRRIIKDPSLPKLLKKYSVKGRRINVVTHFNHPNEVTKYSIKAIELLQKLFQCRPVKRVKHHFQVSLFRGLQIFDKVKNNIGGHIMCKRFKYIMAHKTGKIEVIGVSKGRMYFKYHHAKDPRNASKFFSKKLDKKAGWLDDLK